MKNRLVFVEGLPGAGKTTCAKKICELQKAQGRKVKRYREHEVHPVDMTRQAYLSVAEFKDIIKKIEKAWLNNNGKPSEAIQNLIQKESMQFNEHIVLAYWQLLFEYDIFKNPDEREILAELRSKEICDGNVSFSLYSDIYIKRFKDFVDKSISTDITIIFEGTLIQNILFDLIGYYMLSDNEIFEFYKKLERIIACLNPIIVYVNASHINDLVERTSKRKDMWYEGMLNWISKSPYGLKHNLSGIDGIIMFCEKRKKLDESILSHIGVECLFVDYEDLKGGDVLCQILC